MHAKHVRDIMTPLEEYTVVSENDTLYDAFVALKKSKENLKPGQHTHRAVLVVNKDKKIIGKLGHLGFLKALEPKYNMLDDLNLISKSGSDKHFLSTMMSDFNLWQDELDDVRNLSKKLKMKDVMRPTTEFIDIDASMHEAIHKIVMYQMISVLVKKDDKVVGLVRLTDVYDEVSRNILGE